MGGGAKKSGWIARTQSDFCSTNIKTSKTFQTLVSKQELYPSNSWYPNKKHRAINQLLEEAAAKLPKKAVSITQMMVPPAAWSKSLTFPFPVEVRLSDCLTIIHLWTVKAKAQTKGMLLPLQGQLSLAWNIAGLTNSFYLNTFNHHC